MPGQHHRYDNHDAGRVNQILDMGDFGDGRIAWHLVTELDPAAAHRLLDRVFHTYVDSYCMGKWWVDARVRYIVDGSTQFVREYGFEDGQDTLRFNVHCAVRPQDQQECVEAIIAKERANDIYGDKHPLLVLRVDSSELGFAADTIERSTEEHAH